MASVHDEWLGLVRPIGVVVEPRVLDELAIVPERLSADDGLALEAVLSDGKLSDARALFTDVLGWNPDLVLGLDGGPVPSESAVRLDEHETTLAPTYVIPEIGDTAEGRWQLLVRVEEPGVSADANSSHGWAASPHHRLERLLRDMGVPAGLLVTDDRVRLVTAPKGETSGWLDFLFQPMTEVAGRPILAAMKLLLGPSRLFWGDRVAKLPALLRSSRQAQDNVSTELSKQVLAALHELLRGLYAADPDLVAELARERPQHLYEGLLAVLMRLVFVLYAEDRDLMPSKRDGDWLKLYENSYSLRRLRERLEEDAALYADTMDDRRGAWGQLLALFRLVSNGDKWGWMQPRRGKLFDPDSFPFLEGRRSEEDQSSVMRVSDGCVRRILDQLVVLNGRRLSYRSLDVEQIGSVYETIMGFTVEIASGPSLAIKAGKNNRTPVFVDLEAAAAVPSKERLKWLKETIGRDKFGNAESPIKSASDAQSLASALASAVDDRASPGGRTVAAGTPVLQPTDERRRTGSHYTPRSLTEPIVRKALEPAFKQLSAEATPEEVLDLKVCDPAMGSGAFLVEACRQIAERLVASWERHLQDKPAIAAEEDQIIHARRLVAQRCLYGADRNPMAVDLTKLSLWLATLARDHEFSFLDHALKCGDSLVGLTRKQIEGVNFETKAVRQADLWKHQVGEMLRHSLEHRSAVRTASDDATTEEQAQEFARAEQDVARARLIGDATLACFFSKEQDKARRAEAAELSQLVVSDRWEAVRQLALSLEGGDHPVRPFHWQIEFPEVFARENGGFDAIVGNPPFLGGTRISTANGAAYLDWLLRAYPGSTGRTDLVAFFFRRAFGLIREGGTFGLIATNTIAQGDTRSAGLKVIRTSGGTIYEAIRRLPWPGDAGVTVSVIHVSKSGSFSDCFLDGTPSGKITSYLFTVGSDDEPQRLTRNAGTAFIGHYVHGMGFTFDDAVELASPLSTLRTMRDEDPKSFSLVHRYIGGEEINDDPMHRTNRFVIYFGEMPEEEARTYEQAWKIVRSKVFPERQKRDAEKYPRMVNEWWKFWNNRAELTESLRNLDKCIAIPRVSKHLNVAYLDADQIFSDQAIVVCKDSLSWAALLQSRIHEVWVRFLTSTLEDRLRYAPSDCFETFPLPKIVEKPDVRLAGERYYEFRSKLMTDRNEGMTKTYNRFHNREDVSEEICSLRSLHEKMDRTILKAYGWEDLVERARPEFLDAISEPIHAYQNRLFWSADLRDEVLARLLELNKIQAASGHSRQIHNSTSRTGDTVVEAVE